MTYPLVTQTVITNGKLWSFYVYQLNTTLVHSEHTANNPRRNLCWGTPELKLFEAIEDGRVIGKHDRLPPFNFVLFLILSILAEHPQVFCREICKCLHLLSVSIAQKLTIGLIIQYLLLILSKLH